MASADRMERGAETKRKATATKMSKDKTRNRRVKTTAEKFATYGKPGSRTGSQMEKVSKTRSITTPKAGTRNTRAISVIEPAFKRNTQPGKNLRNNQTFVGSPKPKKPVSKIKYGNR